MNVHKKHLKEIGTDRKTARNVLKSATILVLGTMVLGGCVQITAPEKPIEINLNINIRQEVVYRLDGDAKALIDKNGDIF